MRKTDFRSTLRTSPFSIRVHRGLTSHFESSSARGGELSRKAYRVHQNLKKQILLRQLFRLRIPAKPITDSEVMAITIPSDAERRRSEATLSCSYHAEMIGIRQLFCC